MHGQTQVVGVQGSGVSEDETAWDAEADRRESVDRDLIGMMHDLIECHRALQQRVDVLERERQVR